MKEEILLILGVLGIVLLVIFAIYVVAWAFMTVLNFFNVPFWVGIAFLILWMIFGRSTYNIKINQGKKNDT